MRRDIGTDDPRVKVRPGKGSRPRTKIRPDYSNTPRALVVGVDRGRYRLLMEAGDLEVTAVKARELGRGAIVVGDRVRVTGDVSGRKDTLARVVLIEERSSLLRRSPEDGEGREKALVANADTLAIVTAVAQPAPKLGMIDRCLVAAYDARMRPILVVTKEDLGDASMLRQAYADLGVEVFVTNLGEGLDDEASGVARLRETLSGHETVLVGHSGVGKSTLINALIPAAQRATGHVNEVTGKGRHTSTSAVSFALDAGTGAGTDAGTGADMSAGAGRAGRIIDTPGVRSFGLAHVSADDVLRGFPELVEVAEDCPRGCTHTASEPECALDTCEGEREKARVASYRRLLAARQEVL